MLKRAVRQLLGDYELYRVYGCTPTAGTEVVVPGVRFGRIDDLGAIEHAADADLRGLMNCAGAGSHFYGAWIGDELAAVSAYWSAARLNDRSFWPIAPHEAWWAQLTTAGAFRGRRLAGHLARYAAHELGRAGYRRIYGRVWHNHRASIRGAFERAGWEYVALVATLRPPLIARPLRFVWRASSRRGGSV